MRKEYRDISILREDRLGLEAKLEDCIQRVGANIATLNKAVGAWGEKKINFLPNRPSDMWSKLGILERHLDKKNRQMGYRQEFSKRADLIISLDLVEATINLIIEIINIRKGLSGLKKRNDAIMPVRDIREIPVRELITSETIAPAEGKRRANLSEQEGDYGDDDPADKTLNIRKGLFGGENDNDIKETPTSVWFPHKRKSN